MFRKSILILAFMLVACLCAAPATMAQTANEAAMIEAMLSKEPPLTQADIDNFIKIGPDMVKAASANDVAKAAEVLKQVGWSETRGSFVTAKISNAYAMNLNPEMAKSLLESASMPAILMPTDSEMALVQKNIDALNTVFLSVGAF